MPQSPTQVGHSIEENIVFQSRLITPLDLAKKLNEDNEFLLKELKEEKGIFEDTMNDNTLLAWDTVQRACERRGIQAIEGITSKSVETAQNMSENSEPKLTLSEQEKDVLKYCSNFHKEYSSLIEKSLPLALESKSELAEYHKSISSSIESVLAKVQGKKKTKDRSSKFGGFDDFDSLSNP